MDTEELLLVNCVIYDQGLDGFRGEDSSDPPSLGEWAEQWLESNADAINNQSEDVYEGGMTYEEFAQVAHSVKANDRLADVVIDDVTQRPTADAAGNRGNNMVLRDPVDGSVAIAFMGTCGADEWWDNGQGASVGITDTPDQIAAAVYFDDMRDKYGWTTDTNVTTTGHSKGGNMAAYLAILRPDLVDQSLNVDGQGFNDAFLLKYQETVAAQEANMRTIASAMDYVHIMFTSVGQTTHTQAPDLPPDRFGHHHSPYFTMEPDADGVLHVRPESEQDPALAMAADLVGYLQKFMSAEDFTKLGQMAMQLAMDPKEITIDDIIDTSKLTGKAVTVYGGYTVGGTILGGALGGPFEAVLLGLGALLGSVAGVDSWSMVSDALRPEYKQMLDNFWVLFGNFVKDNGISDPDELKALLNTLFPGWQGAVATVAVDKVLVDLSHVPDLPYSAVVRDFSDEAKQMLLALADEVTPRDWLGGVADFLSDLFTRPPEMEFMSDDEAAHKDYYRRTIDKGNITRQQIEQIFSAVAAEEQAYASKYGEIQGTLDTALGNMDELLSRVEAGG